MLLNPRDMVVGAVAVVSMASVVTPAVMRMLLMRCVHELGAPGLGKDAGRGDLRTCILTTHQEHRLHIPLRGEVRPQALINIAVNEERGVCRHLGRKPETAHHSARNCCTPGLLLIDVVGRHLLHAANLRVQDQLFAHRHAFLVRQLLGVAGPYAHEVRRVEVRAHEGTDRKGSGPCAGTALVYADHELGAELLERAGRASRALR
jgi:hypothetical protein